MNLYTALAQAFYSGLPRRYRVEKSKVKCLLPHCTNLTDHNGGYCCVEHKREHERKTKR